METAGHEEEVMKEKVVDIEQFIMNCDLSRTMQELIGNYIMMEEFFMREMVVKVCDLLRIVVWAMMVYLLTTSIKTSTKWA